MRVRFAALLASATLGSVALLPGVPAGATAPLPAGGLVSVRSLPTTATSSYQDWNWANPDPVYEYTDRSGDLGVVGHDGDHNMLTIDTYDVSTLARVGTPLTISLSGWPDWGGFYAAPNGDFYVLVGRENPSEDDQRNVVAVREYDPSWNLAGTAYVTGDATQGRVKGIYSPFDAGDAHMVLIGNRLVVHMARTIYAIQGVHHQVNLTFEVDIDTMTATTFDELGGVSYSSHSFQQLVAMNGTSLVMVDHGDAYPRAIQMGVMPDYPTQRTVNTYDLFDFNGEEGDNFTGASVTSMVSGPSGVVVLGNSIPQPDAPNGSLGSADEKRNVFGISADPATGQHTVHWYTTFAFNGTYAVTEPRSAQVADNRYAVLFGVQHGTRYELDYLLINSAGDILASDRFADVLYTPISDPIVIGSTVYWVGDDPRYSPPSPAYLFGLDVTDPMAPALASISRNISPTPGTIELLKAPHMVGRFRVAQTIRATNGRWAPKPAVVRIHWYRGNHAIAGARGSSYRVARRDRGQDLRAKVAVSRPGYAITTAWTATIRVR